MKAILVILLTAVSAHASNLQMGSATTVFQGLVPPGVQVPAVAIYYPTSHYVDGDTSACPLSEDGLDDQSYGVTAQISAGHYHLTIPLTAKRGDCDYILDNVTFTADNNTTMALVVLQTSRSLQWDKHLMGSLAPNPASLTTMQSLSCEYSNSVAGLCFLTGTHQESDPTYEISSSPQVYHLDFLAK